MVDAKPIDGGRGIDADSAALRTKRNKKVAEVVGGRQAEGEGRWGGMVVGKYAKAKALAEEAAGM